MCPVLTSKYMGKAGFLKLKRKSNFVDVVIVVVQLSIRFGLVLIKTVSCQTPSFRILTGFKIVGHVGFPTVWLFRYLLAIKILLNFLLKRYI